MSTAMYKEEVWKDYWQRMNATNVIFDAKVAAWNFFTANNKHHNVRYFPELHNRLRVAINHTLLLLQMQ